MCNTTFAHSTATPQQGTTNKINNAMEQQDYKFTDSTVSLFCNINDKKPTTTTIAAVFTGDKYKSQVEEVRQAQGEERKRKKAALPAVTVSAIMQGGHAKENVTRQTDVICIDFDKKDNEHLRNFAELKTLIADVPFVGYCGSSCSGEGFFILMPIVAPYRFAEQYAAAVEYFKGYGLTADTSCKDITRLRFVTYDPKPYINEQPKAFNFIAGQTADDTTTQHTAKKGILSPVEATNAALRVVDYLEAAEAVRSKIADDYETAQRMAFAFATSFGDTEAGRKLYDRYCRLSVKYSEEWATEKYNNAVAKGHKGKDGVSIASFFQLCKDNGVTAAADFAGIEV